MKNLKHAMILANMLAQISAEASGGDCLIAIGPADGAVRWEVLATADGSRVGAGVVELVTGAVADTTAEPVAAGRN